MKTFLVRLTVYFSIHLFLFYNEGSPSVPVLLVVTAMAIGFFILPVTKKSFQVGLYFIQFCLSQSLYIYLTENPFSLLFLLFFMMEAALTIEQKGFQHLLLLFIPVHLITTVLFFEKEYHWLAFFPFLYFAIYKINLFQSERREQFALYEGLLGEYRQLKRFVHESEQAARLEERTKIARDIHDSVGHKLTALLMSIEILSKKWGEEPYKELKNLAKESLEETRYAVRALKTSEYEGISAILQLIKKLEVESHLTVRLTTKDGALSVKLTNDQSVVLYRAIQEGLTNAMRHAHSKEVQLELGRTAAGDFEFIIKNRIHAPKPFQEGFGLKNMRKRLDEIKGTCSIYQTEKEFIVRGHFPLTENLN